MIHRCPDCPGKDAQISKFQELPYLAENQEVQFKQRLATDKTTLSSITLPKDNFIELNASKFNDPTAHSLISTSHVQYLMAIIIMQLCLGIFQKTSHELFNMKYKASAGTKSTVHYITL